jgi:hypothetical protein
MTNPTTGPAALASIDWDDIDPADQAEAAEHDADFDAEAAIVAARTAPVPDGQASTGEPLDGPDAAIVFIINYMNTTVVTNDDVRKALTLLVGEIDFDEFGYDADTHP